MFILITVIIIVVCLLLMLVVLVQNPKGGGLGAGFGGGSGGNQVLGARRTTDFLEKATWYLAVALLVLSLGATRLMPTEKDTTGNQSTIQQKANEQVPSGGGVPGGAPTQP